MSDVISNSFPKATFGGISFPWNRISIKGGLRHHVHEYPHKPGGEIEELGRKLYEFRFSCDFHDTLRAWPKAYPELLAGLRLLFETEATRDLIVPNFGTIKVKAIDWSQNLVAKIRSGESCEFVFLENTQSKFTFTQIVGVQSAAFTPAIARLEYQVKKQLPATNGLLQLLGLLEDAVNFLQSAIGAGELIAGIVNSKLTNLLDVCAKFDSHPAMAHARSSTIADALQYVWSNAYSIRADIIRKNQPVETYYVPKVMSIVEVALAIYGTTDKTVEILKMNTLPEAMQIPAGTLIKHYAVASILGG